MNPEHFDVWLLNATTVEFFNAVKARLKRERTRLADGWHLKDDPAKTNQSYAKAVGATGILKELLDVKNFVKEHETLKGD